MYKDPSEFRKRFKEYKEGKSVREIYGLPGYQDGLTTIELQIVDNQGVILQGYPEIPIDKARAWSDKKYTGNSGETFVKNFANNLISTIQDAVEPYREALNLRLTPQGAFRILMDAGMSKAGLAVGKLISDAAKPVANAVSKSESVAHLTPSQMGRRIKENPQLVSNVNVDDAIKDAMWFHENLVLPAWESRGVHIGLDPKDFSIKQADFGDSKLGAIISEDGDIILNSKLPPERQAQVIEHEFGGHGAELQKRKIKKLYPKQASLINKWDAKDLFLVNQAYNYSDEFLIPRPGFPKAEESVVLNREVQYLISRDNGWAIGPELLLIIKLMPRARLRRYYAEANAYGKEIIKNAKDPDLMPQRTALMNVPVFGGGLYLANTDPNEYKNGKLPGYKNGKIYIKPANRGKFNATKKRTGKTTEELTHSKNPLTRKRAIFALNARKWHHADGKLPGYKDGTKMQWDADTQSWHEVMDDPYANVFNNMVVTPKYIRPKFKYETDPNYQQPNKNEVVKSDDTLWTRLQVEKANNTHTWRSDAADMMRNLLITSDVVGTLYGTGLGKKAVIKAIRGLANTSPGKRAVEVAMRTSGQSFPIHEIIQGFNTIDTDRKKAIAKYVLTGKKSGNFGYYNSLTYPYDRYTGFIDPYTDADFFDVLNIMMHNPNSNLGDIIDAYLYGKKIDPIYGLTLKSKGNDFGVHADYINKYYKNRAKNIPVYETPDYSYGEKYIPGSKPIKWRKIEGSDSSIDAAKFADKNGFVGYDSAGHLIVKELPEGSTGRWNEMELDIWKFNPAEYIEKYYKDSNYRTAPYILRLLGELGVNAVDAAGTPIIVRTPWK